MVTIQITPAQFLERYARNAVFDPINVKVGTEQRVYGKTTEGCATGSDSYKVIYCVV